MDSNNLKDFFLKIRVCVFLFAAMLRCVLCVSVLNFMWKLFNPHR